MICVRARVLLASTFMAPVLTPFFGFPGSPDISCRHCTTPYSWFLCFLHIFEFIFSFCATDEIHRHVIELFVP